MYEISGTKSTRFYCPPLFFFKRPLVVVRNMITALRKSKMINRRLKGKQNMKRNKQIALPQQPINLKTHKI